MNRRADEHVAHETNGPWTERIGQAPRKREFLRDLNRAAQAEGAEFLQTAREFSPRQKAASFGVDQVIDRMMDAAAAYNRRGVPSPLARGLPECKPGH